MRIIPAIDIIDGKCVRLEQGNFSSKKVYYEDPLDAARFIEDFGFTHLHIVDLDGTRHGRVVNWEILERISDHTALSIDFGGGIYTDADLQQVFSIGISQAVVGSMAIKNPIRFKDWVREYGAKKLILAADFRDNTVAVSGWQEDSNKALIPLIESYHEQGCHNFLCTDINRDGLLAGPAFDTYQEIKALKRDLYLIASGGIRTVQDLQKLQQSGVDAAIIGKALYEGVIDLNKLRAFL